MENRNNDCTSITEGSAIELTREYNKAVYTVIYNHYSKKSNAGYTLVQLSCKAINKGCMMGNKVIDEVISKIKAHDEADIKFLLENDVEQAANEFFIDDKDFISKLPVTYRTRGKKNLNSFIKDAILEGVKFEFRQYKKVLEYVDASELEIL